ncbi:MAG: UDP-glucose:undecaprenyl-phosphate glucose-1-phosphate transferase [Candidatus Accumulibacter sp. SK-11]|nr:MAG: UDP-glucose:undecaprenyl-phosphate glucose-1-phosphate transferase [Candidatus Accumulibacter sp. SK-11]
MPVGERSPSALGGSHPGWLAQTQTAAEPAREGPLRVADGRTLSGSRFPMKRILDLLLAGLAALLFLLPAAAIALLVKLTSRGPVLYWSDRIGQHNRVFRMPKFRSMRLGTPAVATHLLEHPQACLTPVGSFLRRSSLDELPQLWSVLVGNMSLVGPRPALYNQHELIDLRTERGVHRLLPGLTGWAQVNGRDELPIPDKVEYDVEYLRNQSTWFDLHILWLTVAKVLFREGVSH